MQSNNYIAAAVATATAALIIPSHLFHLYHPVLSPILRSRDLIFRQEHLHLSIDGPDDSRDCLARSLSVVRGRQHCAGCSSAFCSSDSFLPTHGTALAFVASLAARGLGCCCLKSIVAGLYLAPSVSYSNFTAIHWDLLLWDLHFKHLVATRFKFIVFMRVIRSLFAARHCTSFCTWWGAITSLVVSDPLR